MKLKDFYRITPLKEAFSNKMVASGSVPFLTSSMSDPHIQTAIQTIAQKRGIDPKTIIDHINKKVAEIQERAKLVPSLYQTMLKNIVESEVFNVLWKGVDGLDNPIAAALGAQAKPSEDETYGVKFSDRVFMNLVRFIKADHDEFFPLRGFVDRRVQMNEEWVITPSNNPAHKQYNSISTAAATPNGVFLFNREFMQRLLDYATIKQLKGNGKKYKSNGGPIPDEYAYIEFLIIHELMHFSNDDFYYQHIIPEANNTIINWVGDFRSNYLLVKSGYAQLPMGLYNDAINYDRQSEYIQMYNIVAEEMKKLNPEQQEKVAGDMDGQGDDHEPGQEAGKKQKDTLSDAGKKSPADIDKNAERVENEVGESNDVSDPSEAPPSSDPSAGGQGSSGDGKGSKEATQEIDYTKVAPTFTWQSIAKKFVGSAAPKPVETYAKPHRRAATSADMIAQTGAGAIKPAEKPSEHVDVTLMFVVDSSGSMSDAVAMAYSNIAALLKQPAFKQSDCIIARFSSNFDMHKGNFSKNKAALITDIREKPKKYDKTVSSVFNSHMGYSTDFAGGLVTQIMMALKLKYNVLIFSDSDIFSDRANLTNLKSVIAASPRQVFVLFDKRDTYIRWRSTPGAVTTPNISHM